MWLSLIVLTALALNCDVNCLDCSDSGNCASCDSGLYPSGSNCVACLSEPVVCVNLGPDSWTCYCSSTQSSTSLTAAPGPSSQCNPGYTCYICTSGTCLNGRSQCVTCPNLPVGCLQMDVDGNCVLCNDGYYLQNGKCELCYSSCSTCISADICTGCKSTYVEIAGFCCEPKCTSCNRSGCGGCVNGYLFENGQCNTCPDSCQSCFNGVCIPLSCPAKCSLCDKTGCHGCESGYYLASGICWQCSGICKTCDDTYHCTGCNDPLVLVGGSCCVNGCYDCFYGTCLKCDDNYLFDNYNCIPCPSSCESCVKGVCSKWKCSGNCNSCDSLGNCNLCNDGYYLRDYSCLKCSTGCLKCLSDTLCTSCDLPYHQVNGVCCDAMCGLCDSKGCLTCPTGFEFQNGVCNPCPVNCGGCPNGVCQKEVTPLVCPTGSYSDGTACQLCNPRCTKCDSAENCLECNSPFVLITGYCCSPSCSQCDWNQCQSCNNGYLFDNFNCVPCPDTCRSCTAGVCDGPATCIDGCDLCYTSTTCHICKDGYYLSDGICLACNPRCNKCGSLNLCYECKAPYSPFLGYCCPAGCTGCDWDKCSECSEGLFNDGVSCVTCPLTCSYCTGGICVPKCPDSCSTCTSSTSCTSCKTGFYLDVSTCPQCRPECTGCTTADSCNSCVSPLVLKNGVCCQASCTACNWSGCTGCYDGYKLDLGKCVTCPPECASCTGGVCNLPVVCNAGCATCTDSVTCNTCKVGYYFSNWSCPKCRSNCLACTTYDSCTSCANSLTLVSGICCTAGCRYCTWEKCITCENGYIYDGTTCKPCPSTCSSCTNGVCNTVVCPKNCKTCSGSTCLSCSDGYYLASGSCYLCYSSCKTCSAYYTCTSCPNGQFVFSGACCSNTCTKCNFSGCYACATGYRLVSGACIK